MPLSDEQKKCIKERALPLLIKQKQTDLKRQCDDAQGHANVCIEAHKSKLAEFEADSTNADKRNAVRSAYNDVKAANDEVQLLAEQLQHFGSPQGAFDVLIDNIDTLTAADLGQWCEQQEIAQLEAHISEQEASLQASKNLLGTLQS